MAFNLPKFTKPPFPAACAFGRGIRPGALAEPDVHGQTGAETDPWTARGGRLGRGAADPGHRPAHPVAVAEDIESRGALLNARSGWDATLVNLEGLSEDFSELMATLAEVVQTPGFPRTSSPPEGTPPGRTGAPARRSPGNGQCPVPAPVFGDSPYGHAVPGDLRSWIISGSMISRNSTAGSSPRPRPPWWCGHGGFCPGTGGGGPPLGALDRRRPGSPPYTAISAPLSAPGVYLLDRPDLTQSEIRVGHLGLPGPTPTTSPEAGELHPGEGGFSPRSWPASARTWASPMVSAAASPSAGPGPFLISTFTPAENTAQVSKRSGRCSPKSTGTGSRIWNWPKPRATTWAISPWDWKPPGDRPADVVHGPL